ncbi:hypothetical protein GMRT_24297 [Giardia muris]|uniref:Uncharacterized protein n=1 Tax=Giardia muris TaxID=5742 RepID=A0A4Z1SNQ4_GIAMU|nr:hypothetical protein GMRT_24297 [Giardia muris]|eukprot:TNJ27280.1 hypothetical protein GMRT_24297 [Giardia muris]
MTFVAACDQAILAYEKSLAAEYQRVLEYLDDAQGRTILGLKRLFDSGAPLPTEEEVRSRLSRAPDGNASRVSEG